MSPNNPCDCPFDWLIYSVAKKRVSKFVIKYTDNKSLKQNSIINKNDVQINQMLKQLQNNIKLKIYKE